MNRRKFLSLSLLAAAVTPVLAKHNIAADIGNTIPTTPSTKDFTPINMENMFKDCTRLEGLSCTSMTPRDWDRIGFDIGYGKIELVENSQRNKKSHSTRSNLQMLKNQKS